MKETNKVYKLSVLYMLSKVDMPLTTNRLSFFLLKDDYTDYFTFQQDLGELLCDGYIMSTESHGKTLYSITPEGRNAITLLSSEISDAMKKDIESYIKENKFSMHEDFSVQSRYYQFGLNQYISNLYIEENGVKILEMNINSTTEEAAEKICSSWKNVSEELYPMIIGKLLG